MTRPRPIENPVPVPEPAGAEARPAPLWRRLTAGFLKLLLPLALLLAGGYAAWRIVETAPEAVRTERPRLARLVEVHEVGPVVGGPRIEAWGDVAAARVLSLAPEVAGRVVEVNPALVTGGEVGAGELLFALDDRALGHALAEAEAEIARISAQIAFERGQAARAALDLERLPDPSGLTPEQRALVLREPQMAELAASLAAAEAARDRAAVELGKASVTAPFDALVTSADIALGATLSPGQQVATLVPLDSVEVRIAMPLAALEWLDIAAGAPVVFTQPGVWPDGASREGRIVRVAPALSEAARMAEVIAVVPDPMAREPGNAGKPPLLIGSFLRAEVEGRGVEGAVSLPRHLLRDGDTVWVMAPDGTLEIRPVGIAWRGAGEVLVSSGLAPGERVVATELATVSDGMALRLPNEAGQ